MREGMRHRAVDRQFGTDADGHDHEAELVVQAVGKNPPHVVFDHREKHRERRHQATDDDQQVGSRKAPRQRVDGKLRGEGREHHRADDGGLRIGVLKPAVQQRERRLETESDQDKPGRHGPELHGPEGE